MKYERQDLLKASVFKLLYYNGPLSLAELSAYTKKSIPNITSIINNLVKERYAVQHGLAPSTGGRRPIKYRLNSKKKQYILAVAMDQFVSRIVAYNLANEIVHPEATINLPLKDNDAALEQLCQFIRSYLVQAGIKNEQVLGVGIGMPGFIDVEKGVNASFLPTGSESLGLRDKLTQSLELPIYIENDSSIIAISELHFGAARELKDAMVVNMGWGIGLGMIVNGSLFRGHNGYAGEFSHIPLSHSNKLCSCGKRGCLEVDASLLVAVENAKQAMAAGTTSNLETLFAEKQKAEGDLLIEAAQLGDQLAVESLSNAAFMVGKGIATLIHIMNPERVVLSGRGAAAGKLLLAPVQHAINEFCIPKLAEQTDIVISNLGYQAELLGAASLVIENVTAGPHTGQVHVPNTQRPTEPIYE